MHAFAVGQRREMAETAVARRKVSIALACRTFGVSETCYRYGPKLRDESKPLCAIGSSPMAARSPTCWSD